MLEILKNSGIERLIDFFERDAARNFHVADFQKVPVEVAIAFLRFIRRAFAIKAADGILGCAPVLAKISFGAR